MNKRKRFLIILAGVVCMAVGLMMLAMEPKAPHSAMHYHDAA